MTGVYHKSRDDGRIYVFRLVDDDTARRDKMIT